MSITFFIVGGSIFATYMYFTVWNIYNSSKESKKHNYPNLGSEGCDLPSEVQPQSIKNVAKAKEVNE
jgi:hypothetical protein